MLFPKILPNNIPKTRNTGTGAGSPHGEQRGDLTGTNPNLPMLFPCLHFARIWLRAVAEDLISASPAGLGIPLLATESRRSPHGFSRLEQSPQAERPRRGRGEPQGNEAAGIWATERRAPRKPWQGRLQRSSSWQLGWDENIP